MMASVPAPPPATRRADVTCPTTAPTPGDSANVTMTWVADRAARATRRPDLPDYGTDPGDSANVMMVSVAMTVTYCRPFTA